MPRIHTETPMQPGRHRPEVHQIEMFSGAARHGVVGNGHTRRYFDNDHPQALVAEMSTQHDEVHQAMLRALSGDPRKAQSRTGTDRFMVVGSGCSARVFASRVPHAEVLQISTYVGGQEFFDALIARILDELEADSLGDSQLVAAYTQGPWTVGIGPPEHQASLGPLIETRLLRPRGGIIATFEVGTYAPGSAEESAGNARRAAVCVTKLQGISTELLEQLPDDLLSHLIQSHFAKRKAS